MNKVRLDLLLLLLAMGSGAVGVAQDQTGANAPPKVLQLTREYTKPGKSGAAHDKTESAYVAALARAKSPTHYIALNSITGRERALIFTGYDSFGAWERDNQWVAKNAELSEELARANAADGELLQEVTELVYTYREDLSFRPDWDLSQMRYLEATVFHGRVGHERDLEELVKLYISLNQRAGTGANWATYEQAYGGNSGVLLLLSGHKSLAEIDEGFTDGNTIEAVLTNDERAQLRQLRTTALESEEDQLLAINPLQSYVPEAWVKANPAFWKARIAGTPSAEPAADDKKAAK